MKEMRYFECEGCLRRRRGSPGYFSVFGVLRVLCDECIGVLHNLGAPDDAEKDKAS
jgi:hypothetical protein